MCGPWFCCNGVSVIAYGCRQFLDTNNRNEWDQERQKTKPQRKGKQKLCTFRTGEAQGWRPIKQRPIPGLSLPPLLDLPRYPPPCLPTVSPLNVHWEQEVAVSESLPALFLSAHVPQTLLLYPLHQETKQNKIITYFKQTFPKKSPLCVYSCPHTPPGLWNIDMSSQNAQKSGWGQWLGRTVEFNPDSRSEVGLST